MKKKEDKNNKKVDLDKKEVPKKKPVLKKAGPKRRR